MFCPKLDDKRLNIPSRERNYARSRTVELNERLGHARDESTRSTIRRELEYLARLIERHKRDPHGWWQ